MGMNFTYDGVEYALEFSRDKRRVPQLVKSAVLEKGRTKAIKESTYPYTTATIYVVGEKGKFSEWKILAEAEVGCIPPDKFTLSEGRLQALRKLTGFKRTFSRTGGTDVPNYPDIPYKMRELIWGAYMNREQAAKTTKKELRAVIRTTAEALIKAYDKIDELNKKYADLLKTQAETRDE